MTDDETFATEGLAMDDALNGVSLGPDSVPLDVAASWRLIRRTARAIELAGEASPEDRAAASKLRHTMSRVVPRPPTAPEAPW